MPQPIGAPRRARPARPRTRRQRVGALGLSLALAAGTVSACSSGSGSVETPNLVVGYINGMGASTFLLGVKQGLYNQGGLNVTAKLYNSDAAEEAALKDGDIQIALGDYTSFLDTRDSKVASLVQVIGEAYSAGSNTFGLVTSASSSLVNTSPGDVADKIANPASSAAAISVSVPTFNSPEYVALAAWTMAEQYPMPFQSGNIHPISGDVSPSDTAKQIIQNIASGADQTGVLQEPFLTQALETGSVVELANLSTGTALDMPVSGYFALTKFSEANPRTIAAFDAALAQSQALGTTRVNIEQALEAQNVNAELAATAQFGNFPSTVVPATIDNVLSLMNGAGLQTGTLSSGTLTNTGGNVLS